MATFAKPRLAIIARDKMASHIDISGRLENTPYCALLMPDSEHAQSAMAALSAANIVLGENNFLKVIPEPGHAGIFLIGLTNQQKKSLGSHVYYMETQNPDEIFALMMLVERGLPPKQIEAQLKQFHDHRRQNRGK